MTRLTGQEYRQVAPGILTRTKEFKREDLSLENLVLENYPFVKGPDTAKVRSSRTYRADISILPTSKGCNRYFLNLVKERDPSCRRGRQDRDKRSKKRAGQLENYESYLSEECANMLPVVG